ncbi:MAG TPA: polyribonucleotide nucleotidyltransferase [Acidobacteriota bacterium]|nr:polyribonucleotide nucleotidyltransferase [Acidobacteriota bacterium]
MTETVNLPLGEHELIIETGKVARQAEGSVWVKYGDSVVLVTACSSPPREGIDFLPLTCDYREYTYAAGRIPGGFFKREGRPTEKEILSSRLMDRPLRPLFPESYRDDTQIMAMVLSAEPDMNQDVLGIIGAGAALYLSPIPFHHVVAGVRVGLIDGNFVINPRLSQLEKSSIDLVVAGTEEAIVMVEAGARHVSEETMLEALEFGHNAVKQIAAAIKELGSRLNVVKRPVTPLATDPEIEQKVEKARGKILEALNTEGKLASEKRMEEVKQEVLAEFPEEEVETRQIAARSFDLLKESLFRAQVIKEKKRPDGRAFNEIRPITGEVGLLPRTHGSALFTRGETQALVTVTLGTSEDMQRMEDLTGESSKRFMLHYNFPPFSVGETGPLRGPGRREIGHGALAERAINKVLPSEELFPYTIRVVSDILESNGSSSMATVCGGILALQDAGVPITKPVAGIAMGLIKEGEEFCILSDIAGFEDHYGDMDFKVAGSAEGITALQMDIKITGVDKAILQQALQQAKEGRLFILGKMNETINEPRAAISVFAPRILTLRIPTEKIGAVIGPGGKIIRGIIEQTGVKIDIEDDGTVKIFSSDSEAAERATRMVSELAAVAEIGKTYLGKVTRVMDFGAFVEILPGTEGLLHISEIAERRINDIREEVHNGDKILVKVLNIDDQNKIRLSRRAVLKEQRERAQ